MLQSFSKILQSSLIEYAFHFKRYMLASCANGAKFLLESSSQTYPNHTQNKLVSSLKHAPNILHILLRALQQHFVFFLPYQQILLLIAFLQKISGVGHLVLTIASFNFKALIPMEDCEVEETLVDRNVTDVFKSIAILDSPGYR